MIICHTIDEIRSAVRAAREAGRTIGEVPTMGALHSGHESLIRSAVADGHFVVVTIFVNPAQFGPNEDYAKYPRTLDADVKLCTEAGAEAVFAPSVQEMYPQPPATSVTVAALSDKLCGRSRPGHFAGVCLVVSKLFHIVGPDVAYFGQNDAQQVAVLGRMAADLNFPLQIKVCPTVREADGLAKSSRNAYLGPQERLQAPALHGSLRLAESLIGQGRVLSREIIQAMREHLRQNAPLGEVDYIEVVDPGTLEDVERVEAPVLVALAVRLGKTRLIDNLRVDSPAPKR